MEGAFVGFAVGKEEYVLTGRYFGVDVAEGHGVFARVSLVVGEVDTRNLEGGEVRVEQFDPCSAIAVLIDDAAVVGNHHLVDAQCATALCIDGNGGDESQQGCAYCREYAFHIDN